MTDKNGQRAGGGPGDGFDDLLEAGFAAARAEAARPAPIALLARVEADALRQLPRSPVSIPHEAMRRGGLVAAISRWLAPIGGWPALGGFATATLAGLWLGLSPPLAIEERGGWLAGTVATVDTDSELTLLMPEDYFADFGEG